MFRLMVLLQFAVLLNGCGKQIENFVSGGPNAPSLPSLVTPPLAGQLNSGKKLKISPGAIQATGTTVSANLTLTPTNRTVKGQSVQAVLSLHQSRVQ